ncbi:hypothetical protein EYF80_005585 [Liparis tanakae]|uniref:Uncharacterized protein n=1 Tax=Liparis tanakae TaxID=230148 RepID=A0A4Z2J3I6_9TELE|nr:hypothetical protein EYF80_005585 [Liparis tanakae]
MFVSRCCRGCPGVRGRDVRQVYLRRCFGFPCLLLNPIIRNIQQVETFLRAMFLFQGLQQLLVTLTHQPPPAPVWTPGRGPVDGIIEDGEAQVLEVDPDLVCSASQRATADHAGSSIEAQPLEDGSAVLSLRIDAAEADFKGNDQDGLLGDQLPFWKLTLDSAHILLFKLLESTNRPGEQQHPRGEPVQSVDRVQLGDASLFSQDENHRVVAETAAGVDRDGRRLVDHEHFAVVHQHLQGSADDGGLVAVHCVLHQPDATLFGRPLVVLDGLGSELALEHLQEALPNPPTFAVRLEVKVVRVHFAEASFEVVGGLVEMLLAEADPRVALLRRGDVSLARAELLPSRSSPPLALDSCLGFARLVALSFDTFRRRLRCGSLGRHRDVYLHRG